ncbi:MAG: methionine--tRNA ligase [Candidatus Eremiobacteraeota bacterium]|nr:methionine--tRNA ligase [Candidatus Eremiobacteraeota bacterium]MCW5866940.1 methionine--tRNA ligase [Candidatus Eremiobacteraeota bacterium]
MSRKFYVTTPIYYVNAPPHMGTAYTTILADTLARTKRMLGYDALLVTGSDEHSQGIADKAAAEGMHPEEFCRRFIPQFHDAWKLLNIGPYKFCRTSSPEHKAVVQSFFQKIHAKGDIYKAEYSGWYHTTDNKFVDEGDLPEKPEEHPNLKFLTEDAYWFKLSAYEEKLMAWHEAHPEAIIPGFRRNEMLQRIREGLRDLCISRSSTNWGIPLPWDTDHVFYVWVDALLSYLTGAQGGYWPCDLHIMAKDIPWFHTVIWPAMLMSAEVELPKQVLVHGYWNFAGSKMSKSKGNVFHPQDAVALVGADAVRYFLLREAPLGQDGNFTVKGLSERYNYDLANDFGNLLHRALTMAGRYVNGEIAEFQLNGPHQELENLRAEVASTAVPQLEKLEFREALENCWRLVSALNRFIDETRPWEHAKNSPEALPPLFSVLFRSIRTLLLLLSPIMPAACDRYWIQLGLNGKASEQQFTALQAGFPLEARLQKPEIVFPKLDLKNLEEEFIVKKESLTGEKVERTEEPNALATAVKTVATAAKAVAKAVTQEEGNGQIEYDDFNKVRLITVKVVKAEAVEGSDKLIRLTVDDGQRQDRTIVSGIRKHFTPEHMEGRTICIVDNLKPRKIFGILSEGMILAAGDGEVLRLVTPEGELAPGVRVG